MTLGPIEMVVLEFPESRFTGEILPEIRSLIERGVVKLVDALILHKDADGTLVVDTIEEVGGELGALAGDLAYELDLVSADDAADLASEMKPGSTAAIIVFEHTWMAGVRRAVAGAGGVVLADVPIPPEAVEEALAGTGPT